ncbi:UPF0481 protein At3g47200-like [Eucalyptus grandis]|uniref:UPF0481 protein At3g47200-like n=1 Tax=Eucalyptus grandis TaxID=71139 RepID=UPI00192E8764|nr:UPF0481 protein At3g47200-like [Eucalyptus grandis]
MLPSPLPLDPNETNWIVHVNENLNCMRKDEQQCWKSLSIYKVPPSITRLNWEAYQPQVVSFGPYHYHEVHLHPMKEHKHRALLHFLNRSGKSLERFFESLREVVQKLEDSYDKLDEKKWKKGTGGKFLELMITDGCFMLEIMRTATSGEKDNGYAPNDPIFSIHRLEYIAPYIRRDMLLLENQLPMLVLYQLVAIANDGKEDDVNELIGKFYFLDENKNFTGLGRRLHVMDVYRKGMLMKSEEVQHEGELDMGPEDMKISAKKTEPIIWSVIELTEAGIKFKKRKTNSLKDISFARGFLKLPVIKVDDTTESMFLNVMTFERLHIGAGNEVTSYVTFMDKIINDRQDVALLHTEGIIQNDFGSDKAVAKLFNSLCTDVTLPSNENLDGVQQKISEHCKEPWNKWRAILNRTYFRSPWTILSLTAALFLFALTIMQAVYTVLRYHAQ